MTTAIWWVRRDLRLGDNQALTAALRQAEGMRQPETRQPDHLIASKDHRPACPRPLRQVHVNPEIRQLLTAGTHTERGKALPGGSTSDSQPPRQLICTDPGLLWVVIQEHFAQVGPGFNIFRFKQPAISQIHFIRYFYFYIKTIG